MQSKTCEICGEDKETSEFNDKIKFRESDTEKEINICKGCE